MRCDKQIMAYAHKFHQCDILDPNIVDMMGNTVTMDCEKTDKLAPDGGAENTCRFQVWNEVAPAAYEQVFFCDLEHCVTNTQFGDNGLMIAHTCPKSKCQCAGVSDICDEMSGSMLARLKHTASILCDRDGHNCTFEHHDMPIKIPLLCRSAECVPDYVGPKVPPFKDETLDVLQAMIDFSLLAMAVVIPLACVFRLCIEEVDRRAHRRRMALELQMRKAGQLEHMKAEAHALTYRTQPGNAPLLRGIDLAVEQGAITVLMGPSGTGKSTAMDIMAGTAKSGQISGKMTYSRSGGTPAALRRLISYVPQDDKLAPHLTVEETLWHACNLKGSSLYAHEEKKEAVERTLETLGLARVRHNIVGDSDGIERRGISGGERKRLAIAKECVIMPVMLFLDEPMSGLDFFTERKLGEYLTQLKLDGTAVFMTIHKPSFEFMDQCVDRLVLMSGGEVVYNDHPAALNEEFADDEDAGDYNQFLIDKTHQYWLGEPADRLAPDSKPEDFELVSLDEGEATEPVTVIVDEGEATAHDDADSDTGTDGAPNVRERLVREPAHSMALSELEVYGTSELEQFCALVPYHLKYMLKKRNMFLTHVLVAIVTGLVCGFVFAGPVKSFSGLQSRVGAFLFLLVVTSMLSITSLEFFVSEEAVFVSERANCYYSPRAFLLSRQFCDALLLRIVPSLITVSIAYPMAGFRSGLTHYGGFLLILCEFHIISALTCFLFGLLYRRALAAAVTFLLFTTYNSIFGGFLINRDRLPRGVAWMRHISYWNYVFEALVINEFKGADISFDIGGGRELHNTGDYWLNYLGIDKGALQSDGAALLVLVSALYLTCSLLFSRRIKELK
jgi:ABC-type multidrug transport system ATPase subunit